jgi:two-component system OmpR family sensor kinase
MMGPMTGTTPTTTPPATERRGRPGLSVRVRIAAAVALLVAGALAGTGTLVYLLGVERIEEAVPAAVDQEITELIELQSNGVNPQTGEPFVSVRRLVTEFLLRNVSAPSELVVGAWNGALRRSSPSTRGDLVYDPVFEEAVLSRLESGGATTIDTRWGEVYLEVLPLRDDTGPGAFAVAYFVDDERGPLVRTMRTYAVAASLALVLITLFAAWLAGRLLAPVRILRETADEITETDLSRRIVEVGNDDLTDLTRTINAMLDRLENAFRSQRAFLDDAGHELRTPLTILRGHLELLDPADRDEVDRTRELLLDETDRMSRLVDDMILLTKADQPDFVTPSPVAIDELVDAVADKVRGLGERAWRVDERASVELDVDAQRVTQALVQLAHNAVKHTHPGDTIALGSSTNGTAVRLWVRDTGPGVPDADKEDIFRRFRRADHADDDGVGLGLSIVSAISRAHGGTVHVEDADPTGARFVITLPRTRKEHH